MMKQMPNIRKLKCQRGIGPEKSEIDLTEEEKIVFDNLQEKLGPEWKMLVECKYTLNQNISKLYGLIWVQCNP